MNKYLNTRPDSIEAAGIDTVEKNITFKKEEIKIAAPTRRYLDIRPDSLEAAVTKVVSEETHYQKLFKKELAKTGKSIPQMSDTEKKKFFDKIDGMYKAKDEEVKEANDGDKRAGDPCWKGYKQVGMKDKNGKEVPNCVPMSNEELQEAGIDPKDVKKMEEAVDPETIQRLRQKITDTSNKMTTIDTETPEEKAKAELMASQLKTDKLKLQDMLKKQSEGDKTVKEGDEGKSYKSYNDMKKETAKGKNMKTTMTKKPVTPIEIDPKLTFKDGSM